MLFSYFWTKQALAQEVGDGANPKTILREVAGPDTTWRGRQQQILTLTQKVSELQFKLSQQCQSPLQQDLPVSEEEQGLHLYHIDNGCSDMGGGGDTYRNSNIPVLVHPPGTKRQVSSLHTFEKKKCITYFWFRSSCFKFLFLFPDTSIWKTLGMKSWNSGTNSRLHN